MITPQSRYVLPNIEEKTNYGTRVVDPYSKLFEQRIIFLWTPIDDTAANDIMSQMLILEQIHEDGDRDRWFSAEESLEYGFVDHIIQNLSEIQKFTNSQEKKPAKARKTKTSWKRAKHSIITIDEDLNNRRLTRKRI